jgi:hypothetical protein
MLHHLNFIDENGYGTVIFNINSKFLRMCVVEKYISFVDITET